jgi:hypothetical protein
VYLYYEHHKNAEGRILLTEMRLSSYGNGKLAIMPKNDLEQMLKQLCLVSLKWPPINKRSYDEKTYVWSYFDAWGVQVIDRIKETTKVFKEVDCIEVENLAAQAVNNSINLNPRKGSVRPEDFFYNTAPVATSAMTKETVAEKLMQLIGDTLDKSAYRRAALKFHPDRNNGDGSKMSELNSLWSVYNA